MFVMLGTRTTCFTRTWNQMKVQHFDMISEFVVDVYGLRYAHHANLKAKYNRESYLTCNASV